MSVLAIDHALRRLWWVIFPPFAALALALAFERSCRSPYELLPEIMTHSGSAWPVALIYLAGHVWTISAYIVTARRLDTVTPTLSQLRTTWGNDLPKLLLMLTVLVLEYCPIPVWRYLGRHMLGCSPVV